MVPDVWHENDGWIRVVGWAWLRGEWGGMGMTGDRRGMESGCRDVRLGRKGVSMGHR